MAGRFYFFLFILFIAKSVSAEGLYIGGGFSSISLHSDHPSINDQSGAGYQLLAGTRSENWGMEISVTGGLTFNTGQTPGIYYPEDSAEYGNLELGVRRYFHPENHAKLSPWVGAGVGIHATTWDTYYYEVVGLGYSVAGGVDYEVTPGWFVRGGAIFHFFDSEDTYDYGPYDDKSTQMSFILIRQF